MARLLFLVFICLFGAGLVLGQEDGCVFTELNQGLNPESLDAGANYSAHLADISDEQECRQVCCSREDCQLALIETPADGGSPQCVLVNCMKDGKNVCVLEASDHTKAYPKTDRSNSSTGKHRPNKQNMASVTHVVLFQSVVLFSRQRKPLLLPEPYITTLIYDIRHYKWWRWICVSQTVGWSSTFKTI